MRIAILSDIHSNREALDAVLEVVGERGWDELVLLGDLVGYGPDPVYALETAADLVDRGALCVMGNHDEAIAFNRGGMTENARTAASWTRERLTSAHVDFLSRLPVSLTSEDRQYVHASAERPGKWLYIRDVDSAERCLSSSVARFVFCGHTHIPAIYYALPGRRPICFQPLANVAAPLSAVGRLVVNVGAVGQPRDGNPAACFALVDTQRHEVSMIRVPYDYEETARKIADSGLPAWLGMRLKIGR
ncbi:MULTISPECIES: metallophosphoesterase family protein [unclassified Mesorhizobium]|uniref:metallophosphoesterase family protein n=1 Tax=unclassified Mesorhizobium TaxID=325217 RepID=UPI000FCB3C69|nr:MULTISPECIES: metallophosphoesterase family protein [unclassified Mesorhizobium]RUW76363.1 metallophosphoesterase [Mesorhizobium sp. M4B.F.Ca.ET.049.02.1.2]RWX71205.1 metallophosphoesterase [Mesorhizobium sp. M4B.F.Ca.ET.089.01.1.1]TGV22896.1 metallophosphoesterase [Mesorhizobium sp. M4B.F.Ca.ET.143.01.1.1]